MKIGILKKKEESAVTHYRIAPFLDLARTDGHFIFQYPPETLTDDLCRGLDVLIIHRPASESEMKAVYRAKWAGVAIWLDLDDMLWAIPPANAAYLNYSPQVHTCITDAMRVADVVTVSTQALKEQVQIEFGKTANVIPNAWNDRDDYLPDFWNLPQNSITKVAHRGSNTHSADLFQVRHAFQDIENVHFEFFGFIPWFLLSEYGGNLRTLNVTGWSYNLAEFMKRLFAFKPQFVVFPLEDNIFNKCKSNIAWQEATQAGAITIAPSSMPEFSSVPCILYDDEAGLIEILHRVSEPGNSEFYNELYLKNVKHLRDYYALSKVNRIRAELIAML